ncbi:hypothetical protein EZS27_011286 [termite gut metagenome]|uniref:DUF5013 domain-containing protein n=1 Tax=termite gut metagenome TaxID=433724 RepID=A0A5J4S5Z0_9ZZZZ
MPDCGSGTEIVTQTFYVPDEYAVDTFAVLGINEAGLKKETQLIVRPASGTNFVQNHGPGIEGEFVNGDGTWGKPLEWIVTQEAIVYNKQGWANRDGGVLHPECWGGGYNSGNGIENGKIYRTITLPAGFYTIKYNCVGSAGDVNKVNAYFLAAKGNELPNIDYIPTDEAKVILGKYQGNGESIKNTHEFDFTLDEESEIAFGFVFSMKNESQFRVNSVSLTDKFGSYVIYK